MFSKQPMETSLRFQIFITGFLLTILTVNIVTHVSSILAKTGNHTDSSNANMTFVGNMAGRKNTVMPGGNMTFGASLQNAKMHLTEAIMDLKTGNSKGAMTEMNLTAVDIKMHEQEIKDMMMDVKSMMEHMKWNTTSSSMVSKNAT
ncbi:MAG: hypothetical protein WBZ36_18710 [Candidatus Nitrosopolaris sp.]